MKKTFLTGVLTGALIFGSATVFSQIAVYQATKNTFPVQLNGNEVNIDGYNIDGYTYFKLRDVADAVGDFNVDFQNNTIRLSKNGYIYNSEVATTSSMNWQDMVGEYEGDYMNIIYLENINGCPYLTLATYRGADDISGELTVLEDGSLFYFNGGTRSFTLKFIDSNTIELVEDTWESQLTGKYVKYSG